MRGPATDTIPAHLSALDGPVRTVQVVLPGSGCPSNILVDELLDRVGGDIIFGTSANMSRVSTGQAQPSHNEMCVFYAEFGDRPEMLFIGSPDESAARARFPLHLPGSTSRG